MVLGSIKFNKFLPHQNKTFNIFKYFFYILALVDKAQCGVVYLSCIYNHSTSNSSSRKFESGECSVSTLDSLQPASLYARYSVKLNYTLFSVSTLSICSKYRKVCAKPNAKTLGTVILHIKKNYTILIQFSYAHVS